YLIIGRGGIELHFYGAPDVDPLKTDAMCYLRVPDADALHDEWQQVGIPRDKATGSRLEPAVSTDYGVGEFAHAVVGGDCGLEPASGRFVPWDAHLLPLIVECIRIGDAQVAHCVCLQGIDVGGAVEVELDPAASDDQV